ncbi:MAG: DUF3078 domain-containing protein [Bacteroidetes bacterium]|nr:DUF3078 domain-containing protein [Bacteroidota bacterium]
MQYKAFLIILFTWFSFIVNAQTEKTDSTNTIKTNEIDSISIDSLHVKDTISIVKRPDIIPVLQTDSVTAHIDSTELLLIEEVVADSTEMPDSEKLAVKSYEQVMDFISDSLFFEQADTVYYIMHNLNQLLSSDTIIANDTTKQAIYSLMEYSKKVNIDSVINYLNTKIKKDSVIDYSDSTIRIYRDSLFNAVRFLIESVPEDSVYFYFKNMDRDSVLFYTAQDEIDSVRLNLYDNRGEEAVLWIEKSDIDVFNLYLEDGIYIEKARQQKVVDPRLDAGFEFPELKKVTIPNKILPIWDFEGSADIKFNQGYVSESWAEGGESSISTLSILKYSADYSYGKMRNLDTDVEYRLGYLKAGDNEMQKNDDKFELNVKYGKQAFNNWYYSGLLNFKTQFFEGKEYVNDSTVNIVSEFLSPAYVVFSLGLDYKPTNKLTVLISPLTSKFTIVADTVSYDQTRFGLDKDEMIRKELGAYVKIISKLKFSNNIKLENKLNFFTNYSKNPQNVDVDWELNLGVQLTDYITMSVNTHFIYDDDVDIPVFEDGVQVGITKKAQFKELFGIGFTYSF